MIKTQINAAIMSDEKQKMKKETQNVQYRFLQMIFETFFLNIYWEKNMQMSTRARNERLSSKFLRGVV